ncbi:aromatic aminobenezylarsenical efflux permease ArsG family transporter [Sunxiuqinia elliptica]|uniref:Cytochrome c biogenesis protein CcdA n=1 Tax=Sunxiuqinia elliptica TaxID=655355 RepID=A0A1I2EDH5_9BACT|nr:aromatic aminobenezylarsenical efflux permease ArsG family transporter [Sunxiuqinia elliptica]SFE90521.1 Cytochrome c biogenesis protein CcdA [Sunxiuqinia elliptica]
MQEFFTNLLDQSSFSLWSAFLLGLLTSLGPCTLTSNLAAVGFIGREGANKKQVLLGGLFYTLGRALSYVLLAVILYFGANALDISGFLARYGEKLLAPLLIFIGIVMLDLLRIPFPSWNWLVNQLEKENQLKAIKPFLLGVVFALAFCSYSGVMYFGLLIPMTLKSPAGLLLPFLFALGTGVVVILSTLLLAFAFDGFSSWLRKVQNLEIWLRRGVALLFILMGVYQLRVIF